MSQVEKLHNKKSQTSYSYYKCKFKTINHILINWGYVW